MELIGGIVLVIVVAEQNADEFIADIDLGGIVLLRPLPDLECRAAEDFLHVCLELENLVCCHAKKPLLSSQP